METKHSVNSHDNRSASLYWEFQWIANESLIESSLVAKTKHVTPSPRPSELRCEDQSSGFDGDRSIHFDFDDHRFVTRHRQFQRILDRQFLAASQIDDPADPRTESF